VEVVSGLDAGERVIVEGTQKVRDGAPVNAIDRVADSLPTSDAETGGMSEHAASASPASLRQ
jgi:hypothetical protein